MTTPAYDESIPAYAHGGAFGTGRPAFVVIHSTEGPMSRGNAKALAQWFARSPLNGGPGTSATGIFDPGHSVRMLPENIIPYHVGPNGNPLSNGDEHCGSVNLTRAQWMSADGQAMLDQSARVQAQRARYRGWDYSELRWLTLTQVAARNVNGFCTHNDVRLAIGGTTHSDPGPNFPYAWYMDRIRFWFLFPDGEDNTAMPFTDDDKAFLRGITGGGGGVSIVGTMQGMYNALHSDNTGILAAIQENTQAIRDLTAALNQTPGA